MNEQDRLKKLYDKLDNSYPSSVYFSDDKNRYVRLYRSKRSKYIKKYCNKKVRYYKNDIKNGNLYRKIGEFWWKYC